MNLSRRGFLTMLASVLPASTLISKPKVTQLMTGVTGGDIIHGPINLVCGNHEWDSISSGGHYHNFFDLAWNAPPVGPLGRDASQSGYELLGFRRHYPLDISRSVDYSGYEIIGKPIKHCSNHEG